MQWRNGSPDVDGMEVARLDRPATKDKLRISVKECEGCRYVELCVWERGPDGTMRPGDERLTIDPTDGLMFVEALRLALKKSGGRVLATATQGRK